MYEEMEKTQAWLRLPDKNLEMDLSELLMRSMWSVQSLDIPAALGSQPIILQRYLESGCSKVLALALVAGGAVIQAAVEGRRFTRAGHLFLSDISPLKTSLG